MSKSEQKIFVLHTVTSLNKKLRRPKDESKRRMYSFQYTLKNIDGLKIIVCKTFYLCTLGFDKNNDSFILDLYKVSDKSTYLINKPSKTLLPRGKKKINDEPIKNRIETFNLVVAHYRREHAPNRMYLPSEISATYMYKDFKEKFPEKHSSYEHYRNILKNMNVSFVKLGNEECEICETYNQHIKSKWIIRTKICMLVVQGPHFNFFLRCANN